MNNFKNFIIFYIKVAIIHIFTYIIFATLFSNIIDYSTVYSNLLVANFIQDLESTSIIISPLLEIIRALFIAIALYPIRNIMHSKIGWLYVWMIFVSIGIIATPSYAPSSIEGIIYTKLPMSFHLINLPEILLQTLSFSIIISIVENITKNKEAYFSNKVFFSKLLLSSIITIIGVVLTIISSIIIIKISGLDYINAKIDRATISYITAISIITLIVSYSFIDLIYKTKLYLIILFPLFAIIYIAIPYFYNYILNTAYNTKMALIPYTSSFVIISIIYLLLCVSLYQKIKNHNK